jgi:hypothetical protein
MLIYILIAIAYDTIIRVALLKPNGSSITIGLVVLYMCANSSVATMHAVTAVTATSITTANALQRTAGQSTLLHVVC